MSSFLKLLRECEALLVVSVISDMPTAHGEGFILWFISLCSLTQVIVFLNILENQEEQKPFHRAFGQITVIRDFLKSTEICQNITDTLQTFWSQASSSSAKNFLIFLC